MPCEDGHLLENDAVHGDDGHGHEILVSRGVQHDVHVLVDGGIEYLLQDDEVLRVDGHVIQHLSAEDLQS